MNTHPTARPLHFPPEFRHLWLLFVGVALLNAVLLWLQFRQRSAERPDLAAGYRRYLTGYALGLSLPWLVMGYGIEVGGVPQMFSFLQRPDSNPYVMAFHAVITVELVLLCAWVFLYGGAEFLLSHPGTLGRNNPKTATMIRISFALILLGWVVMLTLRSLNILPVPPLH